MRRNTRIEAASGARVLAGEMLVFGRVARGEKVTDGLIRDAWEIRRDGKLVWADALHMETPLADVLAHPAGFDGAVACATAVYVGDDAADLLEGARASLGDDGDELRGGATLVNGVLILRWLGRDAFTLRRAYGSFWEAFRQEAAGLPGSLPRLWHM